jgi:2-polyprenyl-3-methyl-5-hydroxy-6-metoxy-1,4-benzoquinol methylase
MTTLSEFYDFYDGPEGREDQFDFYASLFDPEQCELLELACGTGILTIELARRGFHITGIDYDDAMLAVANRKLAKENEDIQKRVQFQLGDMSDFSAEKHYGAVIIPTNSFGYLFRLENQQACLKRVHQHLLPQGVLVIEERHYTAETLTEMRGRRGIERTWEARVNPETGKYTMFRTCIRGIDTANQTIYCSTFIDEVQEDGSVKRHVPTVSYFGNRSHYFGKTELQLLVESCGFKVEDIWGDCSRRPFASQSRSIIVVAEKRDLTD